MDLRERARWSIRIKLWSPPALARCVDPLSCPPGVNPVSTKPPRPSAAAAFMNVTLDTANGHITELFRRSELHWVVCNEPNVTLAV